MSRREFLKLGAVWVAAAVSLLIASCGSGGGGEDTNGAVLLAPLLLCRYAPSNTLIGPGPSGFPRISLVGNPANRGNGSLLPLL